VTCIIVDASGINSIDITAADSIRAFDKGLRERKIKFYLTEHTAQVNDQLRKLGLGDLIEKGMVRRTITTALKEIGLKEPYPLEGIADESLLDMELISAEEQDSLQEFLWAFGEDSEKQMEKNVQRILQSVNVEKVHEVTEQTLGKLTHQWHRFSAFDEDEMLERLEMHLGEIAKRLGTTEEHVLKHIEERRQELRNQLVKENPNAYELLKTYEKDLEEKLKSRQPEMFEHMKRMRDKTKHRKS
jgi:hypothetical protein